MVVAYSHVILVTLLLEIHNRTRMHLVKIKYINILGVTLPKEYNLWLSQWGCW